MYLEKLLEKDGVSVEDKFKNFTSEQQIALMKEISNKREILKENKIAYETKIKSLNESKAKLLDALKSEFNVASVSEAEKLCNTYEKEIVDILTEFSSTINKEENAV